MESIFLGFKNTYIYVHAVLSLGTPQPPVKILKKKKKPPKNKYMDKIARKICMSSIFHEDSTFLFLKIPYPRGMFDLNNSQLSWYIPLYTGIPRTPALCLLHNIVIVTCTNIYSNKSAGCGMFILTESDHMPTCIAVVAFIYPTSEKSHKTSN